MESFAQLKGRPLRALTPSVAMTARQKVLLVYGGQDKSHRCLDYFVPHYGDT